MRVLSGKGEILAEGRGIDQGEHILTASARRLPVVGREINKSKVTSSLVCFNCLQKKEEGFASDQEGEIHGENEISRDKRRGKKKKKEDKYRQKEHYKRDHFLLVEVENS